SDYKEGKISMSTAKGYCHCRNDLSILVALLRRRITTHQFRYFVRVLQATDSFRNKRQILPAQERFWLQCLDASIRDIEASLARGSVHRRDLDRLLHLLKHLFLLSCDVLSALDCRHDS